MPSKDKNTGKGSGGGKKEASPLPDPRRPILRGQPLEESLDASTKTGASKPSSRNGGGRGKGGNKK